MRIVLGVLSLCTVSSACSEPLHVVPIGAGEADGQGGEGEGDVGEGEGDTQSGEGEGDGEEEGDPSGEGEGGEGEGEEGEGEEDPCAGVLQDFENPQFDDGAVGWDVTDGSQKSKTSP